MREIERSTDRRKRQRLHTTPALAMVIVATLTGIALPAAAAQDGTFGVALNRQDRLQIEQLACGAQYGLALADADGRAFDARSPAQFAEVRCRPHAQLGGQPLYYVAQCARDSQRWQCSPAELETVVRLAKRDVVIRPGSVDPQKAVDTLRKVAGYGYFQGMSLDKALQSVCNMGMGDRPELIELSCQRWSVTVSYWCPKPSASNPCPRVIYMHER
ncbi:hypothetical protein [Undibacterium rugosum]|uniref:Uncharacterized protein n=2 Tax=Undibacterium TaxID=401469 RepID=A0A923KXZ3_9BURK|nr:hypothetical protein [Undibacterium rugosum]MBC3933875.1 hypothetical protein [Undibacterium rugosum]MBR7777587.1 hypothetical protein [Undibacterium rugosum]